MESGHHRFWFSMSVTDPVADISLRRQTEPMSEQEQPSPEDQWQDQSMDAVHQFSDALIELHRTNPWPNHPFLPRAIIHLTTELWDRGFSQSDIREAFDSAIADLPRYASGDEVRP